VRYSFYTLTIFLSHILVAPSTHNLHFLSPNSSFYRYFQFRELVFIGHKNAVKISLKITWAGWRDYFRGARLFQYALVNTLGLAFGRDMCYKWTIGTPFIY